MRPRRLAPAVLAAAAALGAWTAWFEPRRLVVRRLTLAPRAWPASLDGLRLVVVSDLHAGGPHVGVGRVRHVVQAVNAQRPDAVALLGDFVDHGVALGGEVSAAAVAGQLAGLRAARGTYAVLGNHDWRSAGREMGEALERVGIHVLENRAVRAPTAAPAAGVRSGQDGDVWFVGLADATERRPDIARAVADVPDGAAAIALTHDPDLFPDIPDHISLTLAGHTHGGQVAIPLLRRFVIRSDHADRYAAGHVVEGERQLYVTVGVGESGFPLRLLAPPEIVVLTLRCEHSAQRPVTST